MSSKKTWNTKLKMIALEENREKIDLDISVVTSAELNIGSDFGYDGTAIYIQSKEKNLEELYIISQGSQDVKDWEYNMKSMLAGINVDQANSANDFYIASRDYFKIEENIPVIGLSHSLAHNNNLTASLLHGGFNEIYSVNGAQTNYYQLFYSDFHFQEKIIENFGLTESNLDAIYDLDPDELHDFAQEYYKGKIPVVNQRISTDDPLYALNTARGFFQLGNVQYIDTNPDYPGLHSIMEKLPDDIVKDIQSIAIDYTTASNIGGSTAGIQAITGIDMDTVKDIPTALKTYALNPIKFDQMLEDANNKLPRLLAIVQTLFQNSDVVFQEFIDTGYITPKQKALMLEELKGIENNISKMETAVSGLITNRKSGSGVAILSGDITAIKIFKDHANEIMDSFERINTPELQGLLGVVKSGHDIPQILEALNKGNKSYLGTDMVLTSSKKGKEIKVNISAALRMYRECKLINEDQHSEVKKLQEKVDYEIKEEYATQVTKVKKEVRNMEENPSSYDYLLRKHVTGETWNKQITKINVQEYIGPLQCVQELDGAIDTLRKKLDEQLWLVEDYRKIIESLFDAEERISLLFNEIGGI